MHNTEFDLIFESCVVVVVLPRGLDNPIRILRIREITLRLCRRSCPVNQANAAGKYGKPICCSVSSACKLKKICHLTAHYQSTWSPGLRRLLDKTNCRCAGLLLGVSLRQPQKPELTNGLQCCRCCMSVAWTGSISEANFCLRMYSQFQKLVKVSQRYWSPLIKSPNGLMPRLASQPCDRCFHVTRTSQGAQFCHGTNLQ